MVGPVANHKEAPRQATSDDMEAHEATFTRLIPSSWLSINLLHSIWAMQVRYEDCGSIHGRVLSSLVAMRLIP